MAKIYNEIVIDMNPESPTFEETLFEDSYDGEIGMHAQGDPFSGEDIYVNTSVGGNMYNRYRWSPDQNKFVTMENNIHEPNIDPNATKYTKAQFNEVTGAKTIGDSSKEGKSITTYGKSTAWGAGNISKDDFIDPATGAQLTMDQVYANLKGKLPGLTESQLRAQINELAPKFQGVDKTERAQARESFQKDVYGVSKEAGKAGAAMRGAYGSGMGAGMRGAVAAGKDVGQQFKQAEQAYAQYVYGLEKAAGDDFESDIEGWISGMENPFGDIAGSGREGGYIFKDGAGVGKNTKSKKTFLDILSELPDAKGS